MSEFSATFLGTGGTAPSAERGMPATLIKHEGTKFLVDCGEGTQRQLWIAEGGLTDLDAIFLTHYHSDHILGLPGLLNSYQLRGRDKPLPIYGPKPLLKNLHRFSQLMGTRTKSLLEPTELKPGTFELVNGLRVRAFPVNHGSTLSLGYKFSEPDRPGRFNVEKAARLGIFPGPNFGKLQRGESVLVNPSKGDLSRRIYPDEVIGPDRPGRRILITGDTAPCELVKVYGRNVDLLIHEATLLESDADRALKTEHSSAHDAANVAEQAGAKRLALYHISPRRKSTKPILKEAWQTFMGATVPNDFDKIEIPLV